MSKGRKPLPTEIKELQGTAQPCRLNKFEPKVSEIIDQEPPEYLSNEAKVHWKFIMAHEGGSWIKQCDRAAFEQYCEIWAELTRYRKERRELQQEIDTQRSKVRDLVKKGMIDQAMELQKYCDKLLDRDTFLANIIVKNTQPFKSMASELGFTPSSRSRVIAVGASQIEPDNRTGMLFDDDEIARCLSAGFDYSESVQ